jgi:hypothetical protein
MNKLAYAALAAVPGLALLAPHFSVVVGYVNWR